MGAELGKLMDEDGILIFSSPWEEEVQDQGPKLGRLNPGCSQENLMLG